MLRVSNCQSQIHNRTALCSVMTLKATFSSQRMGLHLTLSKDLSVFTIIGCRS